MFLQSVRIKNFRSLEDAQLDDVQRFSILIGRNNAGKSSVLNALAYLAAVVKGAGVAGNVLTAQDTTRSLEFDLAFAPREADRKEFIALLSRSPQRRDSLLNSLLLCGVEFQFRSVHGSPHTLYEGVSQPPIAVRSSVSAARRIHRPGFSALPPAEPINLLPLVSSHMLSAVLGRGRPLVLRSSMAAYTPRALDAPSCLTIFALTPCMPC